MLLNKRHGDGERHNRHDNDGGVNVADRIGDSRKCQQERIKRIVYARP